MAPTLRKTGTVIDEISVAHSHRHSFPQNAKIQIDKDLEIKPERPYIELTAETAKSLIQLTAKTGTGILAGRICNVCLFCRSFCCSFCRLFCHSLYPTCYVGLGYTRLSALQGLCRSLYPTRCVGLGYTRLSALVFACCRLFLILTS
jgi:hypothetical protein